MVDGDREPTKLAPMRSYLIISGLCAIVLTMSTPVLHANPIIHFADHEPVEPFDLFVDPPENHDLHPDDRSRIGDPLILPDDSTPLDRELNKQERRKQEEENARAVEEAKRKAANQALPPLSDDREERLDTLFETLKTAQNRILAQRAEQEIRRTWDRSGSDTIDLLLAWTDEAIAKHDHSKALDFLDNIIRLQPDFSEGWNRRATVYFLQKNYTQSIADVERTLQLEPRHFAALNGLGRMLQEIGKEKEALEAFSRALEINPRLKNVEEAIANLKKKVEGRAI